VTLKVKVTNISEVTKQTIRSGQQLDKCVATLNDHSGSIPYTIWDKDLGRISLPKCYKICDASVRSFDGKALTTCPTTTIVEIADKCKVFFVSPLILVMISHLYDGNMLDVLCRILQF
jgi:hypothetical protein